jgi:hypothetical protein
LSAADIHRQLLIESVRYWCDDQATGCHMVDLLHVCIWQGQYFQYLAVREGEGIQTELKSTAPYRPDLASCDFHLFSPWRNTCPDIVSWAIKTSNLVLRRGWRNKNVRYMRTGWTKLSHAMTDATIVRELRWKTTYHRHRLCILSVPSSNTFPLIYGYYKPPFWSTLLHSGPWSHSHLTSSRLRHFITDRRKLKFMNIELSRMA